ncbi:MAG: guanylate kinase [Propionibacteriaceae bacterium]|nr:guanylate kinase [Micropruina sp.]
MTGDVTVICGPTAVGKGTIVRAVAAAHPEVWVSVSATTRAPRPTEVDGVDYLFVTEAEFDELVGTDGLLEWAAVHTTRYGTPAEPVRRAVAAGRKVILEIDVQGARQVRQTMPEARFIFIEPPSMAELRARLAKRGTETEAQVAVRLKTAEAEMAAKGEFEHLIVNDDLGLAVSDLLHFMGL